MRLDEFLLARIAEDEAAANRCAEAYPSPWDVSDRGHSATVRADQPGFRLVAGLEQHPALDDWLGEYLEHIARHDPARVLAECAAKRQIIEMASTREPLCEGHDQPGEPCEACIADMAVASVDEAVLGTFAVVYRNHPEYAAAMNARRAP